MRQPFRARATHHMLLALIACVLMAVASAGEEVRLSALDLRFAQQGWGLPGINRSVEGKPLRIAGREFAHGYGTHAAGAVHLDLGGDSARFTARVGIDDEGGAIGGDGSVVFIVEGDGKVLWTSPLMRGNMEAQPVDVPLAGVKHLVLKITDGNDGTSRDHADWAEATFQVNGQRPVVIPPPPPPPRWTLGEGLTTVWTVAKDTRLPHGDFIEQGGLRVGQVASYSVDGKRTLSTKRSVVWPCLRTIPNNTHASLTREYGPEAEPAITVDGAALGPITVDEIVLDGALTIRGQAGQHLAVTRCTFPSPTLRTAIERWTIKNNGDAARTVAVAPLSLCNQVPGPYGTNHIEVTTTAPANTTIAPGQELSFAVLFRAWLDGEKADATDSVLEEIARRAYVAALQRDLRLETPVPEFDRAFAFCKLRVAEAINATRGGMMLAPGGLSYYAAVWCNDNVEYAGPFFPFLGDRNGNQASLDTYRIYQPFMKQDYKKIPSSIIAEGVDTWGGAGDRGDAAMYAYGCARFCLARGDRTIAEELWPAIVWCLEYCKRKATPDGVIASDTDELENRLPAGKANLSTATLCYGGLRSAADLGRALGHATEAQAYDQHAEALAKAIDNHFGATVEGFATYRYYDGNTVLRSWICMPLCMGLMERREGTIAAIFSPRLWTLDGLASQAGDKAFWDRSTLYGFRGVFQAGETATGLRYLEAYTRRRLLGEHVPYPVEAWPEGGQRHLSSESGLYCRIFTEGLFGILPTGLDRFRCTPRLPDGWPRMALRSIRAFGREWDLVVERKERQLRVSVQQVGKTVFERTIEPGTAVDVVLP